jgi:hypothetical protein
MHRGQTLGTSKSPKTTAALLIIGQSVKSRCPSTTAAVRPVADWPEGYGFPPDGVRSGRG